MAHRPKRMGKYRDRVVRLVYASTKEPKFGGTPATYTDGDEWFAEVVELNASISASYAARDIQADAEIRIRGLVELSALDRIRVKRTGYVYALSGVRREDGETVAAAFRHAG